MRTCPLRCLALEHSSKGFVVVFFSVVVGGKNPLCFEGPAELHGDCPFDHKTRKQQGNGGGFRRTSLAQNSLGTSPWGSNSEYEGRSIILDLTIVAVNETQGTSSKFPTRTRTHISSRSASNGGLTYFARNPWDEPHFSHFLLGNLHRFDRCDSPEGWDLSFVGFQGLGVVFSGMGCDKPETQEERSFFLKG